jgi:L-aspartate oxidase
VASTGLHGANRLASNSLLEAAVCGRRCADAAAETRRDNPVGTITIPPWEYGDAVSSDEGVVVEHNWNEVRSVMWDFVGIVRSDRRLARARRRIQTIREEIRSYYNDSAQRRKESRGLHYNEDWPQTDAEARHTLIQDRPGGPLQPE